MKLLRDPEQWDLELLPREGVFPERSRAAFWTLTASVAVAATAIIAVAALGISSLHVGPPVTVPGTTSTATPEPTEPTTPPLITYEGEATCETLLDYDSTQQISGLGWTLDGPDFVKSAVESDTYPAADFVNAGGLVCSWGGEPGAPGIEYGYGPISEEQEEAARIKVSDNGGIWNDGGEFETFTYPQPENPDLIPLAIVFARGYWAYAEDHTGGIDIIDDLEQAIVRFAPPLFDYDGPATCENLLDGSTKQELLNDGWAERVDEAYIDKVTRNKNILGDFVAYGGIICVWGPPGAGLGLFYGFGPITETQADEQRAKAVDDGATVTTQDGYDVYTMPDDAGPKTIIFGEGTWGYAWDNGGGEVMDDIIANAPQ